LFFYQGKFLLIKWDKALPCEKEIIKDLDQFGISDNLMEKWLNLEKKKAYFQIGEDWVDFDLQTRYEFSFFEDFMGSLWNWGHHDGKGTEKRLLGHKKIIIRVESLSKSI